MLNLQLSPGDYQSDMVVPDPATNPPRGAGGGLAAILTPGHGVYSPSGAFRFYLQFDGNAVIQVVDDSILPSVWRTGALLDPNDGGLCLAFRGSSHHFGRVGPLTKASLISRCSLMAILLHTTEPGPTGQADFHQIPPTIRARFSECRTMATW